MLKLHDLFPFYAKGSLKPAEVCDGLSGDCNTNAFKTSAGYWKRRIPSSWALPSRREKKGENKEKRKKRPQKPLKICEASELKEKDEGGYAYSPNDFQGKISFSKIFTRRESIFLRLLPSSGSPLSPRCCVWLGDHCPKERGSFRDGREGAMTRL